MRQMRAFAVATIFFISSCSGSGGFTEGLKLGKKSESKEEETKTGDDLGKEKDGDDTSDQPVQITGTYLTCAETESTDTNAVYGCRVASKKDGSTVALNTLASDWTFDYDILKSALGTVTVKASNQNTYQIFFDFEASSNTELKALLAATKIILDMNYLPGVGNVGSGPAFEGLIATFIPKPLAETTNGSQDDLSTNIIGTQPIQPDQTPVAVTPATQQPVTTPVKPNDTGTTPATVQTPVAEQPGTQTTPVVQNSTTPDNAVEPAALDPKDPVAFFTLVKATDGTLTLQAYFDQISGLTNPTFTSAKNLAYAGGVPYADGTAMIMLTTPMAVSVKKGEKTCSGNGTIGAGVISIPLTCK